MELIHPNYHVILIHFPLALLGLGIFIELFSFLWPRGSFRVAGRWMIVLGALLAIPAATAGIYAFRDVVGGTADMTWIEHKTTAPLSTNQWDHLTDHLWLNVAAVSIFLVAVIVWIGASDAWRRRLHWPILLILVIGMGLLTMGAWHGGEMVYVDGVAVAHAGSPAEHTVEHAAAARPHGIEKLIDPMQAHLILVGLTLAFAAAAIGLSFRSIAEAREALEPHPTEIPVAQIPPVSAAELTAPAASDDQIATALRGEVMLVLPPPHYPPARFWLLAVLLGLLAAVAGLWLAEAWTWAEIKETLENSRDLAHGILGTSIIVLSLILAGIARWSRRSSAVLSVFTMLLILAVAAQIWMGVLLTFDGMANRSKTWYRFQTGTSIAAPATRPSLAP